jgi:phosphatidylinositol glycan class A protein
MVWWGGGNTDQRDLLWGQIPWRAENEKAVNENLGLCLEKKPLSVAVRGLARPCMAMPRMHRIAMVCDFFHPSVGGVEHHIHRLAECLIQLGHHVVVVTHARGVHAGVQWLAGVKVYYLPVRVFQRCALPSGVLLIPHLRRILIREAITTVHAHAVCTMSFEAALLSAMMGYRVVYTEHSNYGSSGVVDHLLNALCRSVLSQADAIITVSRSSKANVVDRCRLEPSSVCVVPNAVDSSVFRPNPANVHPRGTINVAVVARLVWRKGVHLLCELVPTVCAAFPHVHFLIAGDGPHRAEIEAMVAWHGLGSRVELLGAVAHADVPALLTRCHIFLNTSLTEAFCIAILEAACCGLRVVSTDVGGVPEILPPHMIALAKPNAAALAHALADAIRDAAARPPPDLHDEVAALYSWEAVARQTATVYDGLHGRARPTAWRRVHTLVSHAGLVWAPIVLVAMAAMRLALCLGCLWHPASAIRHGQGHERERSRIEHAADGRAARTATCEQVPVPYPPRAHCT